MNQAPTGNFSLDEQIRKKIAEVHAKADEIPGVIIILDNLCLSVKYMSPRGLELLGVSMEELIDLGPAYHARFFNLEEAREYVPKIAAGLERNDHQEWVTFFQQVRHAGATDWTWYASSTKIFMRDEAGRPLLSIAVAVPLDPTHHLTNKVDRLQKENEFLRKHYGLYAQLTKREQEILKLTCLGKSAGEIADELFISTATVDTHRKNIKKKLGTSSAYELSKYALAFDLI